MKGPCSCQDAMSLPQGLNFYPDFRSTFNPPLLANIALAKLGKMSPVPMSGAGFPPGS